MIATVDGPESKAEAWSGDYDPTWYTQQAIALGYISADQATKLLGDDEDAAVEQMRTIWDFATDPAFATGVAESSLDWPANTPADQIGPGRWREPISKVVSDQDHL
jgi:hypothetical protein